MPGICFVFVLEVFWIRGRLCVRSCASVCVPPSMSILDQCEIEAVVIKRIRCFLMRAVGLCVKCRHMNVHKASSLHGELEIWQCRGLCMCVCLLCVFMNHRSTPPPPVVTSA